MKKGYKCFGTDLTNRYGQKFELNRKYIWPGDLHFGSNGQGWHFCKNLEDTLRYSYPYQNDYVICEVIGSGNILESFDAYNEYFDMYCSNIIEITKVLSREEIIEYALSLNSLRLERFVSLFKLAPEEISLLKEKFKEEKHLMVTMAYYQEGDKKAFEKYNRNLKIKPI